MRKRRSAQWVAIDAIKSSPVKETRENNLRSMALNPQVNRIERSPGCTYRKRLEKFHYRCLFWFHQYQEQLNANSKA